MSESATCLVISFCSSFFETRFLVLFASKRSSQNFEILSKKFSGKVRLCSFAKERNADMVLYHVYDSCYSAPSYVNRQVNPSPRF